MQIDQQGNSYPVVTCSECGGSGVMKSQVEGVICITGNFCNVCDGKGRGHVVDGTFHPLPPELRATWQRWR